MVINAGARIDIVNYNSRMWADPNGKISPYTPYFYLDANSDENSDDDFCTCDDHFTYVPHHNSSTGYHYC